MAFDDAAPAPAPTPAAQPVKDGKTNSTRLMVALAHNAGPRPVTRRMKSGPIPREARVAFGVALGVILLLVLIAFLRSSA